MGKGEGKGGIRQQPQGGEQIEVLIHGRFYDVTNLKHPGGSVIKFYKVRVSHPVKVSISTAKILRAAICWQGGEDATQAFDNFHFRSQKAKKWMATMPSRSATIYPWQSCPSVGRCGTAWLETCP